MALLASQSGSTFQYLTELSQKGELGGEVALLICNNPKAYVIKRAQKLEVPTVILPPSDSPSFAAWDQKMNEALKEHQIDFIALCGFMRKIGPQVLKSYPKKIVNTHPSLLPQFGGQGMYGLKVHEAVIKSGVPKTGVTVHYLTDEYDEGEYIAQKEIPVDPQDTPESLSQKVQAVEKPFYAEVIRGLLVSH